MNAHDYRCLWRTEETAPSFRAGVVAGVCEPPDLDVGILFKNNFEPSLTSEPSLPPQDAYKEFWEKNGLLPMKEAYGSRKVKCRSPPSTWIFCLRPACDFPPVRDTFHTC